MTRTVWKFPFPVADEFSLIMPEGAEILHFDVQHGIPTIWALVDPSLCFAGVPLHTNADPRRFRFAGTGHPIPNPDGDELRHIGSCQMHGGALVFHLFEFVAQKH